jgi:DNA-binding NarL/FixJ family response regulator
LEKPAIDGYSPVVEKRSASRGTLSRAGLIVEDEPLVALEWKETLESAGYEVAATLDSADVLINSVRELKPDLVLMDVRLRSFLDGIDAVSRLRFLSSVPVIYLTAYSTPDILRRAEGTLPAAFLTKPVEGSELVEAVRKVLSQGVKGS